MALHIVKQLAKKSSASLDALKKTFPDNASQIEETLTLLCREGLVKMDEAENSYRLAKPSDFIICAGADHVSLVLPVSSAAQLATMLEHFVRACLGQASAAFENMRLWRPDYLDNNDQQPIAGYQLLDEIHRVVTYSAGLKPNESWTIYNAQLLPQVAELWSLFKAIQHRLAWDANPDGGHGVAFDEPIECSVYDLHVNSFDWQGQQLVQILAKKGLFNLLASVWPLVERIEKFDLTVWKDLAKQGWLPVAPEARNGWSRFDALDELAPIVQAFREKAAHKKPVRTYLDELGNAIREATEVTEQNETIELEKGYFVTASSLAFWQKKGLPELPPEYLVASKEGRTGFRVICFAQEKSLLQIGMSGNLKTAIWKARRHARNVSMGKEALLA